MLKSYITQQEMKSNRQFSKVGPEVYHPDITRFSREGRRDSMLNTLRLMSGSEGSEDALFQSPSISRKNSLNTSKRMSIRKGSIGLSGKFPNIKEESDDIELHVNNKDVKINYNDNLTSNKTKGRFSTNDHEFLISGHEVNKESKPIKGSVLIKIDGALGTEPTRSASEINRNVSGRRGSLMHKLRDTLQSQITEDKPKSRSGRRGSTLTRLQDVVFDVRGGVSGMRRGSIKNGTGFLATGQGAAQNALRLHFQLKKLRQRNKEKRLRKFRSSAKIIIFLHRLCKTHYLSANDRGTATRGYVVDDDHKELLFDVTYFKANRKAGISSDAKRMLTTSAHERTDKEKYHCLISLRNYKTFAEYPLGMQRAIVQCAWYETYSAKRVILRQGHNPHNFYFILSGSVLVNVLEPGSLYAKTVVYLHKGETFGELAIVNKAQRQSTIIAREVIELLCIDAENYVQIFMAGGISTLFDPENDFVKNLKFLEGWPLHLLVGNRKKCVFSYFMRGDVLIKNSKTTDWILIVKSGSCSVMKRLQQQVNKTSNQMRRISLSDGKGFPDHLRRRKRLSLFPGLEKVAGRSFENFDQRKRREEFESFLKELDNYEKTGNKKRTLDGKRVSFQHGEAEGGPEGTHQSQARRRSSVKNSATKLYKLRRSTFQTQKKKPYLERPRSKSVPPSNQASAIDEDSEDEDVFEETEEDPLKRFYKITGDTKVSPTGGDPVGKRKTMVDEVIDTNLDDQESEDGVKHIWVNVQTLTKGSVFGLAELAFGLQPSFAVVSNGAECILLSKKFYLEHVDSHMMTKLRSEEYPYPTDEEMQAQLEVELKWETFRIGTLEKTINMQHKEKFTNKPSIGVG